MLDITKSSDFKRVGDKVDSGYYDISLFNDPNIYECKGTYAMDQALENYLLTIPGERLFNLKFGSPLYLILFQKNVDQDEIRNSIYQNIENALSISIDRSTADLGQTDDPHVLSIHFRYSTRDGVITNHEFTRRFSK
jgi:phage baseplate assembly protein W